MGSRPPSQPTGSGVSPPKLARGCPTSRTESGCQPDRVSISPDGMTYEPGSVDDLPSVLEFDAGSLVLTAFGRYNTGTFRGDRAIAERFLNLFFRI